MKKALAILVCLPLLALSSDARTKNQTVLVPHAQAKQESLDASDKDRESEFFVREAGNAFDISAGMIAWSGDTASLALKITNATGKARVFAPE